MDRPKKEKRKYNTKIKSRKIGSEFEKRPGNAGKGETRGEWFSQLSVAMTGTPEKSNLEEGNFISVYSSRGLVRCWQIHCSGLKVRWYAMTEGCGGLHSWQPGNREREGRWKRLQGRIILSGHIPQ